MEEEDSRHQGQNKLDMDINTLDFYNNNPFIYISSGDGKRENPTKNIGGDLPGISTSPNNLQPLGSVASDGDKSDLTLQWDDTINAENDHNIVISPIKMNLDATFYNIYFELNANGDLIGNDTLLFYYQQPSYFPYNVFGWLPLIIGIRVRQGTYTGLELETEINYQFRHNLLISPPKLFTGGPVQPSPTPELTSLVPFTNYQANKIYGIPLRVVYENITRRFKFFWIDPALNYDTDPPTPIPPADQFELVASSAYQLSMIMREEFVQRPPLSDAILPLPPPLDTYITNFFQMPIDITRVMITPLGLVNNQNGYWNVGNYRVNPTSEFISPRTIDLRRTRAVKVLLDQNTNSLQTNEDESGASRILLEMPYPYFIDELGKLENLNFEAKDLNLIPKVKLSQNTFNNLRIQIVDDLNQELNLNGGGYTLVLKTMIVPEVIESEGYYNPEPFESIYPMLPVNNFLPFYIPRGDPRYNFKDYLQLKENINKVNEKKEQDEDKNKVKDFLQIIKKLNV